jgi:hypothetical protein
VRQPALVCGLPGGALGAARRLSEPIVVERSDRRPRDRPTSCVCSRHSCSCWDQPADLAGSASRERVTYLARAGSRIRIVISALLINAAIDVADSQDRYRSSPDATSVAYLVYVPGHVVRAEGHRRAAAALASTFARCPAAAAAPAAVLLAVGLDDRATSR